MRSVGAPAIAEGHKRHKRHEWYEGHKGRDEKDERDERDNNEVGYHLSLLSLHLCVSVVFFKTVKTITRSSIESPTCPKKSKN